EQYQRWQKVMSEEYHKLIRASEHGRATLLDQYGTTNEAEFFAVATECFFDKPVPMRHRHPELYEVLRDYYQQDPAARCGRPSVGAARGIGRATVPLLSSVFPYPVPHPIRHHLPTRPAGQPMTVRGSGCLARGFFF